MIENRNVPWRQLRLWPGNPRRRIDEGGLRELADSIAAKGILQNLVARQVDAGDYEFEVITGQRRWRAIGRLVDAGVVGDGFLVPLRVGEFSDHDALLLATAENVGREDMTALEEADAFRRLLEEGESVETIAATIGKSAGTVQRRLALHRLSPRLRQAVDDGAVNMGQAAAFTLGSPERQNELLDAVLRYAGDYSPSRIREALIAGAPPLDWALFGQALYKGPVNRDLFHERSYAEDRAQFRELQIAAVEAKAAELRETWAWAEAKIGGFVPIFDYDRTEGAPHATGAIVHLRDDLRVEIHTGLRRREPGIRDQGSGIRSHAPRAAPSPRVRGEGRGEGLRLAWAAERRLRRLQTLIAADWFVALEVAIGWALQPAWGRAPPELDEWLRDELGDAAADHRALAAMPLDKVQKIFAAIVAQHFGEAGETVQSAIARELGAEPLPVTAEYLEQLDRTELFELAGHWGIPEEELAGLGTGELVDAILLSPAADRSRWHPPELCFQQPKKGDPS
jgi:ParB/RepB/Spo0J family partition protein